MLDPIPTSPSPFTHSFLLKLSLEPPVASQQAVSSSANTYKSALNLCNLQTQAACIFFYPLPFPLSSPPRKRNSYHQTYLNHHTPDPLPTLTHPNAHVRKQRRVADI